LEKNNNMKKDEACKTLSTIGKEEGKSNLEEEGLLWSLRQRWSSKSHMLEAPSKAASQGQSIRA